jgi:hypothetical protein
MLHLPHSLARNFERSARCLLGFLDKDVESHHSPPGHCHVDTASDSLGSFDTQFPEFTFEMFDMRLVQLIKPDIGNRFEQAQQPRS